MFRPSKPGDWADDQDDELPREPTPAEAAALARAQKAAAQPSKSARPTPEPKREDEPAPPVANRWERFRQQQQQQAEPDHAPPQRAWDRDSGRGSYGARDRDYGGRDRDRDRDYGSRDHRGYGGNRDREWDRGTRAPPPPPLVTERGVVVSIRDNFGFVSGVERDNDLFFHISEAPVDLELQDEVEFKVKYNQRSEKDIAVQLVRLPKGSIVWEDVAEEFVEGIVTKGIPRSNSSFHHSSTRDEPHGLIEVREAEKIAGDEKPNADAEAEAEGETTAPSPAKRSKLVRYTADSVADQEGDSKSSKKPHIPHFGDHVRFRIATHRKSGQKRAVDLTVTLSAKAQLEKEIEAKLESMTRELGVVTRVKSGGGFIRCCDRTDDVYFPFHEIRESIDDDKTKSKGKLQLRDGDEVSFYVYEDKDAADERPNHSNSHRLTAMRVVKVPSGTVSFEDVLRTDVEGVVTKIPKEPRNGPEIFGVINPTNPDDIVTEEPLQEPAASSGKKLKKKAAGVSFRLSDAQDVSYLPAVGDIVSFDQVMDKRSRRLKASNVRVVQFNPKTRETGVITTIKDDFGFIKCADRSADAYFRFSDVMSVENDFRTGTEVAFDVSGSTNSEVGKGKDKENVRAHRVQILPSGTVQWESVLASDLEGEIIAVPSRHQKHQQSKQGSNKPLFTKPQVGRIRLTLGDGKHLVDFFPDFKKQIDATFVDAGDEATELKVEFPSTLSKYERAAIHAYCEWLGVSHESTGDGPNRRLTVSADGRLKKEKLEELQEQHGSSTAEIEFHAEDVEDVRYNPHIGDRVKVNLIIVKRTKQVLAKCIVLVSAALPKQKTTTKVTKELPTGEGFIVALKADGGFGFIEPADQGVTGGENLFFHIKDIASGETQVTDLKEGMEVKYRVSHDEKKKKSRAVEVVIVPSGTVKRVEASRERGVVLRPSLLQKFRKTAARYGKNDKSKQPQISSPGRIRLVARDAGGVGSADLEAEEDDEDDEDDELEDEAKGEAEEDETNASSNPTRAVRTETKQAKAKSAASSSYVFFINDIMDPAVVLREGDEVEFVPHISPKGLRAMHIRLVQSHAKQGVVVKVNSDNSGVIRVDNENDDVNFKARDVLRGDILGEGDRVEFALVKRSEKAKQKVVKSESDEPGSVSETVEGEKDVEALNEPKPMTSFFATSVLCLGSSGNAKSSRDTTRPESRTVNSSLRQAMRSVGVSAVAKSRMAKGPDGTRGFKAGWRSAEESEAPATPQITTNE